MHDLFEIKYAPVTDVGQLEGQFRVDESGAATYSISVALPPGTAGSTPSVSLSYSSQGGSGVMGRGWNMSASSSISRCGKSLFLDGTFSAVTWSKQDEFCINGQRLLLTSGVHGESGATYTTQNFSASLVTLHGSVNGEPNYFTRINKDGTINYYGFNSGLASGSNSKQQFASGKTLSWSESLTMDNMKNAIVYKYSQSAGNDFVLDSINYAYGSSSTPNTQVKFEYERRPDISRGYFAGIKTESTLRLRNLNIFNSVQAEQNSHSNKNIRTYQIYYNKNVTEKNVPKRSLVAAIQECVLSRCRTATSFNWNVVQSNQPTVADRKLIGFVDNEKHFASEYRHIDMNGDGIMDMVWTESMDDTEPFNPDRDARLLYAISENGKLVQKKFKDNSDHIWYRSDDTVTLEVLDFNADGKQDVAVYGLRNGVRDWHVYLSERVGSTWRLSNISISTGNTNKNTLFSDFDGDGLTDMLEGEQIHYLKKNSANPSFSSSSAFYSYKTPVSRPWSGIPNRDTPSVLEDVIVNIQQRFYGVGDFNGDGRMDILAGDHRYETARYTGIRDNLAPSDLVSERLYALVQTDTGFEYFANIGERDAISSSSNHKIRRRQHYKNSSAILGDINGDGLSDVVFRDAERDESEKYKLDVFISNGVDMLAKQQVPYSENYKKQNPQFVDFNRDGILELFWGKFEQTYSEALRAPAQGLLMRWDGVGGLFNHIDTESVPLAQGSTHKAMHTFIDINGDGISDVVRFEEDDVFYSIAKAGLPFEAITGIHEGVKPEITLTYEPINNSEHYRNLEIGEYLDLSCVATSNQTFDHECAGKQRLTSAQLYTTLNMGIDAHGSDYIPTDAPALLFSSAYYVVTKVQSHTPYHQVASDIPYAQSITGGASAITHADTTVTYHYNQAMYQGGRGFLGFKGLTSIDHQSGIKTTTEYHQASPYQGMPRSSYVRLTDGSLLSESHSVYALKDFDQSSLSLVEAEGAKALGPIKLFTQTVYDTTYATKSDASGVDILLKGAPEPALTTCISGQVCPQFSDAVGSQLILNQVVTQAGVDSYLNAQEQSVLTKDALLTQTVTTTSMFPENMSFDLHGESFTYAEFGRVKETTVSRARNGIAEPDDKKVTFEYHASGLKSGMLKQDTTVADPNNALAESLVTVYDYDGFGNLTTKSHTGWNGQATVTRSVHTQYDASGRFVTVSTDALGNNYQQVKKRNEYGAPTRVEGVNGFDTETTHDTWGIEQTTVSNTQEWVSTFYAYCDRAPITPIACPAGAQSVVYKYNSNSGEGVISSAMFYDVSGRELQSITLGFDGNYIASNKEYDFRGRVVRASSPYFVSEGGPSVWMRTYYDILSNPIVVVEPNGAVGTITYQGFSSTTTNNAGNAKTEVKNTLGELVRAIDANNTRVEFDYTIEGELRSSTVVDGADNAFSFGSIPGLCRQPVSNLQTILCFDRLGRKTQMWDPDKGLWQYEYNAFGELIKQVNSNGHQISTEFDNLGRTIKRIDTRANGSVEGTTAWYYDDDDDIGQEVANARLKLTAVVYTENGSATHGNGQNYVVRPLYDSVGRQISTTTFMPDGNVYESRAEFDLATGRLHKEYNVLSDWLKRGGEFVDSGVEHHYNSFGQLYRTTNLEDGRELYLAQEMDARGQLRRAKLGDLIQVQSVYNPLSGLLEQRRADVSSFLNVQNLHYNWDKLGNLLYRQNTSQAHGPSTDLKEGFCYDNLNRLIKARQGGLEPDCTTSLNGDLSVTYDKLGNIKSKTGVGSYQYNLLGSNGLRAGPHAVTSVGSLTMSYDASGNMLSDGERTITYSTYDKPLEIIKGQHTTRFKYGPGRSRFYREDVNQSGTEKTWYLGSIEKVIKPNGDVEWRRMLPGGGLYTYHTDTSGSETSAPSKRYILKDHLGSTDVILNESNNGNLVEQTFSFDPWGQRRASSNMAALSSLQLINFDDSITNKGFTGHEMLDAVGIVHMNGRIYDPRLGRFLQADPHIDGATSTQGYNRYSYVHNNPLNATDPTGYFLLSLASFAVKTWLVRETVRSEIGAAIFQAAACAFGGAVGCAYAAFVTTGVQGGSFKDALKAGAIAGVSSDLGGKAGGGGPVSQFVKSGLIGGAASGASGGNFSRGFFTAGISSAIGGRIKGTDIGKAFVSALVGGTTSKISGGKFVNGAVSSAFEETVEEWGYDYEKPNDRVDAAIESLRDDITENEDGSLSLTLSVSSSGTKGGNRSRNNLFRFADGKTFETKNGSSISVNLTMHDGEGYGDIHAVSQQEMRDRNPESKKRNERFKRKKLYNKLSCISGCAVSEQGQPWVYIGSGLGSGRTLHELFHSFGVRHRKKGLMHFEGGRLTATDVEILRTLYFGGRDGEK